MWETKTIGPDEWEDVMTRNYWSLVVQLSCSRGICLICLQLPLNLCFSVPLCEGWLWLFLIRCSKLKNSSTKWQSPWSTVEWNRRIILPLPDDMICPSVMIICTDSWIFHLCIPVSLPQSKTRRQKAFSPNAGARTLTLTTSIGIWHSAGVTKGLTNPAAHRGHMAWCGCHERSNQSRSSQGYMAWCGCHEILIPLCYPDEVFCRDQKTVWIQNSSHPDDRRITQRSQSNTTWRDKNK